MDEAPSSLEESLERDVVGDDGGGEMVLNKLEHVEDGRDVAVLELGDHLEGREDLGGCELQVLLLGHEGGEGHEDSRRPHGPVLPRDLVLAVVDLDPPEEHASSGDPLEPLHVAHKPLRGDTEGSA
eukprot:457369-Hanusia_phi.AAC.1